MVSADTTQRTSPASPPSGSKESATTRRMAATAASFTVTDMKADTEEGALPGVELGRRDRLAAARSEAGGPSGREWAIQVG